MKALTATIAMLLAAATLGGCALARAGDRHERREAAIEKLRDKFQAADADHDGFLSHDEVDKGMPRLAAHFDDADTDRDGKLSMTEVGAYVDKARTERGK